MIESVFQGSLLMLILTGFVTLAGTGKLDSPSVVLVSCALAGRIVLFLSGRQWVLPERWVNPLGLLYLGFYLADLFLISQNFVAATVHLVLYGMSVKLYTMTKERDYIYLAVLAFLELLSAAVLTVGSGFLPAFGFFLLLAIFTFMTMEIRRSTRETGLTKTPEAQDSGRRAASGLTWTALVLIAGTLFFGAGIFFLLPRLSYGYMSKLAQQNNIESGYSDGLDLSSTGTIHLSSSLVAHVKIEEGKLGSPDLHLRGTALSNFDGVRWSSAAPNASRIVDFQAGAFDVSGLTTLGPGRGNLHALGENLLRYSVMMEAGEGDSVFLLDSPRLLFGRFHDLTFDEDGGIRVGSFGHLPTIYEGISAMDKQGVMPNAAASQPVTATIPERYLHLPILDPRIAVLASQITAGEKDDSSKAAAIVRYLDAHYSYTLTLPSTTHKDPLAYFLFERKQGHCEYFASAMAVLLRASGIPSRVVTGFRGGEFNSVSDSYILRGSDAHAWVEAYLQGRGWTSFDPTPASGKAPPPVGWHRAGLYLDAMREYWREWIVNYDFQHQKSLVVQTAHDTRSQTHNLVQWSSRQYEHMKEWARSVNALLQRPPRGLWRWLALALVALLMLFNLRRLLRSLHRLRLTRRPQSMPKEAASLWFQRAENQLARHGWRRNNSETATELAFKVTDPTLRRAVIEFVDSYERARFGESPEAAASLPTLYEAIRLAQRQR